MCECVCGTGGESDDEQEGGYIPDATHPPAWLAVIARTFKSSETKATNTHTTSVACKDKTGAGLQLV